MTEKEAKWILKKDNTKHFNWFKSHGLKENEMLIYVDQSRWVVCATDERAAIVDSSIRYFDNVDALNLSRWGFNI